LGRDLNSAITRLKSSHVVVHYTRKRPGQNGQNKDSNGLLFTIRAFLPDKGVFTVAYTTLLIAVWPTQRRQP